MEKIYRLIRQIAITALLLFSIHTATSAQFAIVTHVSGEVWLKNTPVTLRMHIGPKDTLKGKGTAEVGLLDLQRGRVLIQFKNGRRIAASPQRQPSELYQLTIGQAMEDYHSIKQGGHLGVFDFNDFLSDSSGSGNPLKFLLVSGQGIPLESQQVKIEPTHRFFLCPVSDTNAAIALRRTADSLYIPQLKTAWPYLLQVRYPYKGKEYRRFFPAHMQFSWLSGAQIHEIAQAFIDQRATYYHNHNEPLLDDIHQELFDWYGRSYTEGVDRYFSVLR